MALLAYPVYDAAICFHHWTSNWRLCYTSPHDSAVIVPVMNPSQLLLLWTVKCRLSTLLIYHNMHQTGVRPTRASSGCGFRMFHTESLYRFALFCFKRINTKYCTVKGKRRTPPIKSKTRHDHLPNFTRFGTLQTQLSPKHPYI